MIMGFYCTDSLRGWYLWRNRFRK